MIFVEIGWIVGMVLIIVGEWIESKSDVEWRVLHDDVNILLDAILGDHVF